MNFRMSNRTYDVLCWIVRVVLPALGTLYFAVARTWGFPCVEEILGTLSAVEVFMAAVLGISTAQYTADNVEPPKNPIGFTCTEDNND